LYATEKEQSAHADEEDIFDAQQEKNCDAEAG